MAVTNRHITYFVEDFNKIDYCGTEILQFKAGSYELPFETKPTKGEHSFKSCENCRKHKEQLIKDIKEKLKFFPYCCEFHKNLNNLSLFKIEDFENISESIANKIMYTYHHILNYVDTENWKKEVIDYIEYTAESYGSFPNGHGEPFQLNNYYHCTLELLSNTKNMKSNSISDNELKNRLKFITDYLKTFTEGKREKSDTDINDLLNTYQKWLKTFPFDLNSYFGKLKPHFEKQLPFLQNNFEKNIYSGLATARIHSKESLTKGLINLTDNLLTQINGAVLYEKGLITDANKIKLELLINSRKLKISKGYKNEANTEDQPYSKMLEDWFADEKEFIDEITPLIKVEQPVQLNEGTPKELHNNIFKGNSFEVWQSMFDSFKIKDNSPADIKFMFEVMKYEKLIHPTVRQIDILEWINNTYQLSINKARYTDFKNDTKRMAVYNQAKEIHLK